MSFWSTYLAVVAGIVISVLYPILRQALPRPRVGVAGVPGFLPRAWNASKPYIVTLIFAFVTAPLIMAFLGDKLDSWPAALLAGFAWEATIEKVKEG
jgi:chromate transport protein ChrA